MLLLQKEREWKKEKSYVEVVDMLFSLFVESFHNLYVYQNIKCKLLKKKQDRGHNLNTARSNSHTTKT